MPSLVGVLVLLTSFTSKSFEGNWRPDKQHIAGDLVWYGYAMACLSFIDSVLLSIFFLQTADSADGGKMAPRSAFKFSSVGSQFKKQLGDLMSQLHTMEPHYVRCVKPNGLNRPGLFENSNALHQLRCGGRSADGALKCVQVYVLSDMAASMPILSSTVAQ